MKPINVKIRNSYSIKYLGVTNGKIGILTKRVPITESLLRSNKSVDFITFSKVGKNKPEDTNESLHKTYDRVYDTTVVQEKDVLDFEKGKSNSEVVYKLIKGELKEMNSLETKELKEILNNKKQFYVNNTTEAISGYQDTPIVESEYLVNRYSFPNALSGQKKQKTMSEAEEIFTNKYSPENIALITHMKTLCKQKQIGFKGKKVSSICKRFADGGLRCLINRQGLISIGSNIKSGSKQCSFMNKKLRDRITVKKFDSKKLNSLQKSIY